MSTFVKYNESDCVIAVALENTTTFLYGAYRKLFLSYKIRLNIKCFSPIIMFWFVSRMINK